jgi:hypothetical protein
LFNKDLRKTTFIVSFCERKRISCAIPNNARETLLLDLIQDYCNKPEKKKKQYACCAMEIYSQ